MRIPTGNFGNVVAEPQRQAQISGGDQIGRAVQGLGQAIGGAVSELKVAEQQKQRAQAASVLATTSNDAHDLHDQISRDVNEGKVAPDQAIPEFKKRLGERTAERTKDLTPDQRMLIDDNLIRIGGTLERNLNGVVLKRTQADTDANAMTTLEQLGRAAMRDLPGAIKSAKAVIDGIPHWDPVKKAELNQRIVETFTFNSGNAALEGYANKGDLDGVRTVRSWIEGPEGEAIDPAKRTALITKAYAYENGILAAGVRDAEKAKREQEARENKARDAYKDAQQLMLNGRYLSTEYITQLADITAGTSAAPAVQALVKSQAEAAGFASMPLSQQAATIERMRSRGSTPGVGTDPEEQKLVDYMQRIHDSTAKAYAENPWQAAQERGVIKDAPTIQLNNVQDAQAVLSQRMQQINQIEVAAGRKVSPLQPQEAETIGRLVRALPPDQQSSALASFSSMIGDGERILDFARQIDDKDKVLGTMMIIGDLKTTQGRYVMELGLKGERALRDKSIIVDNARETGWRGAIANEIRGAYPSQRLEERLIDAAYYVTAGMAAEGSADPSRAVRMVAGRIIEHNGSKIPLPTGMEEDDFEKRLRAIQPSSLAAQAPTGTVRVGKTDIPVDQFVKSLPDATLEHAGQGRYVVKAGMSYVTRQDGKKLVIEVRHGN